MTEKREFIDFSVVCCAGDYLHNSFYINKNTFGELIGSNPQEMLTLCLEDFEIADCQARIHFERDKYWLESLSTDKHVLVCPNHEDWNISETNPTNHQIQNLSRFSAFLIHIKTNSIIYFKIENKNFSCENKIGFSKNEKNHFLIKCFLQLFNSTKNADKLIALKNTDLSNINLAIFDLIEIIGKNGCPLSKSEKRKELEKFLQQKNQHLLFLILKNHSDDLDYFFTHHINTHPAKIPLKIETKFGYFNFLLSSDFLMFSSFKNEKSAQKKNQAFFKLPKNMKFELIAGDQLLIGRQILQLQRTNVGWAENLGSKNYMEDFHLIDQNINLPDFPHFNISLYAIFDGYFLSDTTVANAPNSSLIPSQAFSIGYSYNTPEIRPLQTYAN